MVEGPGLGCLIDGNDYGGNQKDERPAPANREPAGPARRLHRPTARRPAVRWPAGRWAAGRLRLPQRRDNPPLLHATHRAAYGNAFSLA